MASEEAAVTMMNYYTSAPPTIRNQPVFIQYSTHRELKTDNLTNQVRNALPLPFPPLIIFRDLKSVLHDSCFTDRGQRCRPSLQPQCILGLWRPGAMVVASLTARAPSFESLWRICFTR